METDKEIKEEMVKGLGKTKYLKCPICKHTNFIRKTYDRVNIIDEGEEGVRDEILDYEFEDNVYICQKCGWEDTDIGELE